MNDWLKKYNSINNKYAKKSVYRIGIQSGFFSEYNNMLLSILYCLTNNIKFILTSRKNNFSYQKGWKDYFLPFCEEVNSEFYIKNSSRSHDNAPNSTIDKIVRFVYKKVNNVEYLTQDIWSQMRSQYFFEQRFYIPELSIDGSIYSSLKVINENIWRLEPLVEELIRKQKEILALPAEYIGIHIRSGDKSVEHQIYSVDEYILKAASVSSCKALFIATDDFANVKALRENYSDYTVYSLCSEQTHGFDEYLFNQPKTPEYRRDATLSLLVDVELLSEASLFIGTYSSNIGMFMGLQRDLSTCYGLDFEKWQVW